MDKKKLLKVAFCNQKGGVAKTTSCINIAGILAKDYGYKVLVVDADPQANATTTLLAENINEWESENAGADWFDNHVTLDVVLENLDKNPDMVNEAIEKAKIIVRDGYDAKWRGIDVLPSHRELSLYEVIGDDDISKMVNNIRRGKFRGYDYDVILFDLPPYLSELTVNVLNACDHILVPATVDKDSLEGFSELMTTVNNIKVKGLNPTLDIMGVFLTMIDNRTSYDKQMYERVKESIGNKFIDTPIRLNSEAKKASHIGCPLAWYKRNAPITRDYKMVTAEMLHRAGMMEKTNYEQFSDEVKSIVKRYIVR